MSNNNLYLYASFYVVPQKLVLESIIVMASTNQRTKVVKFD